jgi:hypothetical protein
MIKIFIYIISTSCITSLGLNAQSIDRSVTSTAGGSSSVNGMFLDWTIGEPITETIHNDVLIVSEGFHQQSGSVPLYSMAGNILGNELPYSGADVFLFLADADNTVPSISKIRSVDGSFRFSFISQDQYVLYAVPDFSDEFFPTYYVKALDRNDAYILETDANIGGLDLQLVSKLSSTGGMNPEPNADIKVFPNPVLNDLNISINYVIHAKVRIKIVDLSGKVLIAKEIYHDGNLTLDLSRLAVGSYLVNVNGDFGFYNTLISKVK